MFGVLPHVILELPMKYYLKLRLYFVEAHPAPSELPVDGMVDVDFDKSVLTGGPV